VPLRVYPSESVPAQEPCRAAGREERPGAKGRGGTGGTKEQTAKECVRTERMEEIWIRKSRADRYL
uniref:hypothetical protein n=1 Tax=Eisenbergiella tayi TaxID=1432052 RepID=UPI001C256012